MELLNSLPTIESEDCTTSKPMKLARKKRPSPSERKFPTPTARFNIRPAVPHFFDENGLRKVKPYMFTFQSWAKERWQNRTVIDVYSEFRDRSREYYDWAIKTGAIGVNNAQVSPTYVLKNGDLLQNLVHRHEPPVRAGPIRIIYDGRLPGNDGVSFVVEKPGSMPVHPTGRYCFNTLLEILKYDYDLPLVHTSNRLDRLTSGVMVCSLTVEGSKSLGMWFGGRHPDGGVHKEYIARVKGRFMDEEVTCEEPLLTVDRQVGLNCVHPDGRPSKTIFRKIRYIEEDDTTVVHCTPITGRSHQIRVHLQFIGFPIANDPVYCNVRAWGPLNGLGGVFPRTPASEARRLLREASPLSLPGRSLTTDSDGTVIVEHRTEKIRHKSSAPVHAMNRHGHVKPGQEDSVTNYSGQDESKAFEFPLTDECRSVLEKLRASKDAADGWARWRDTKGIEMAKQAGISLGMDPVDVLANITSIDESSGKVRIKDTLPTIDLEADEPDSSFCDECFVPLVEDPKPDELFIWLHALRYKTTEWDWSSELPSWAVEEEKKV